jgi:hypothetical protein
MILLRTVAPYCLSDDRIGYHLDPEEQNALLTGLARNSQQYIKYQLVGTVHNFMADKVFTQRDVYPFNPVKQNLGLIGDNASKSFMDV